jgi:signal transduction histidine kinase
VTGLRHIQELIGDAAMPVALQAAGEPRQLPFMVDFSAYRVVRDALAGARQATRATVAIEYMPGALAVQVDHDGCGAALTDVANLAATLGGGLTAAKARGRFRVRAWLPTEGQPPYPAELLVTH